MDDDYDITPGEIAPKDRFSIVFLIFVLLGIGSLFPWNCFLVAYDYFHFLYPDFPFQFVLAIVYNYAAIIFLLISVKFGPRFPVGPRIVVPFIIILIVIVSVPIVTIFLPPKISLWLVLTGVFFTGCAAAILFGSTMGLAALFPFQFMGALMTGNGVAGIASAGIRIITKSSLPDTPEGLRINSSIYFGVAAGIILACIMGYLYVRNNTFALYYIRKGDLHRIKGDDTRSLLQTNAPPPASITGVFKKIWLDAITVIAVFFVTLSLFPGVTSLIVPHSNTHEDWFQLYLTTTFMIGDLVGRTIPRWIRIFPPNWLWAPVAVRFVFFVLFPLCVKGILTNDAWPYAFMGLFALTNGYTGTLAMMYGPGRVDDHEKELAGQMMGFFLNFGIFTAVHFALLVLFVLNHI